jgi:hypothetical protein
MKSLFKIKAYSNDGLQKVIDQTRQEYNKFFDLRWERNTPKLLIVDDRETVDLLHDRKTKDWEIGWGMGSRLFCILNPEYIDKQSSHSKNYSVEKLIKHELAHCYFDQKFGTSNFSWINEGTSIYLAGQTDVYPMPEKFWGFLDPENSKMKYQESGSVIKLLIDNFGKDVLFDFFEKQKNVEHLEELGKIFKQTFNVELSYKTFNDLKA